MRGIYSIALLNYPCPIAVYVLAKNSALTFDNLFLFSSFAGLNFVETVQSPNFLGNQILPNQQPLGFTYM